jgi:hypothetical protein
MPNLCGWVRDWTLYPLSSQGDFLRAVSALLTRNFRRIYEEDLADVHAVTLPRTCRERGRATLRPSHNLKLSTDVSTHYHKLSTNSPCRVHSVNHALS